MAFGASLDALDAPEKVEMKRAYLDALGRGRLASGHPRDPYDLLIPHLGSWTTGRLRAGGKLPVEDWLTPRPSPRSRPMLTPERFRSFIDGDGCRHYARRLEEFVLEEVLPRRPLMLGVDHSLSAGAIGALASVCGVEELRVIVVDAHSDVLSTQKRRQLYRLLKAGGHDGALSTERMDFPGDERTDSFNCGSFLHHLLAEGRLDPRRLFILGASDLPPGENDQVEDEAGRLALDEFRRLRGQGVSFLGKRELRGERGMEFLREALEALGRGPCYVSLDLDVGALEAVRACRFMDLWGMSEKELQAVLSEIAGWLVEKGNLLVGLDVMEMDVHLAGLRHRDGTRDRTPRIAAQSLMRLLDASRA